MESAWVVCQGEGNGSAAFHSLFLNREKAIKRARSLLKEEMGESKAEEQMKWTYSSITIWYERSSGSGSTKIYVTIENRRVE